MKFLDWAERRVRFIVAARKRRIQLLGEYRQALINDAVTGKFDVRTGKPYPGYKDSGVPWLGKVPEGWGVGRLKGIYLRIVGGSTPPKVNPSYWDGDVIWVTPSDVSKTHYLTNSVRKITRKGLEICSAEIVPAGSIVITTRAPVGNVAIAEVPLCTNQGCKALVPNKKLIESKYAFYVMTLMKDELQSLATGTTFAEISMEKLASALSPLPSLPEQRAIAEYLDRETAEIDAAIEKTKESIALWEELRETLISDVVTGKLDMRKASERLPEEEPELEERLKALEASLLGGESEESGADSGRELEQAEETI